MKHLPVAYHSAQINKHSNEQSKHLNGKTKYIKQLSNKLTDSKQAQKYYHSLFGNMKLIINYRTTDCKQFPSKSCLRKV